MAEDAGDKQFAPTERRLQEARTKGQVPIGRDLLAAVTFAGFALALFMLPKQILILGDLGVALIEQAPALAEGGMMAQLSPLFGRIAVALAPLFLLPAAFVIVALIAQQGIVFANDRIQPKLSRISILQGVKRRFGLSGLVEFVKSTVKLVLITLLLSTFLSYRSEMFMATISLDPRQGTGILAHLLLEFLILLTIIQLIIGALDLLWQRFDHIRNLRMTRKEMTDDMKNSDGDPHMKAQRRRRAEELATNQMIADVAKANVVIVNPSHYAVALKWTPASPGAPICVAKGVDEVAARIRAKAAEHAVPIRRDPPVARALYATVKIGDQIEPEHYRPVAAAIRYAEALRRRTAQRGWGP